MDHWSDIRRLARAARAEAGSSYATAPAASFLDELLRRWEIDVDDLAPDHPLLRGARAAWREEYGLIVVDRTLSAPERLFAIAHELGHRQCHPGSCTCEPGEIDDEASTLITPLGEGRVWGYNPRQAREMEANIFAGELLAPSVDVRARFLAGETYLALANYYGVTPACILNNLVSAVLDTAGSDIVTVAPPRTVALDPSQRRAAETNAQRVLVDAGPGTGKTCTLIARVLHLLSTGIAPDSILVLTFSNRAADELRERLRTATRASNITISTFHSFALDMLRRFAPQASLPDNVQIIDDVDAALLLERALPELHLEQYARLARPTLYLPSLLAAVSRMRDELISPDEICAEIDAVGATESDAVRRTALEETRRLLATYERLLHTHGVVDYGMLIARAVWLMQTQRRVAQDVRRGLRHVLVDEYQDVNRASAVLLRELVSDGAALWVVGDVRQSIYRFRGAEPRNMLDFERDFPDAVRLTLDSNYRAAAPLVDLLNEAAEAIAGARGAWIAQRTDESREQPTLFVAPDEASERAGIVGDIAASIKAGLAPENHAVLCRTHRQATEMAAALGAAGLPTSYLGSFFVRPEIKDLLALLQLCRGPDGAALLRLATWPEYQLPADKAARLIQVARERRVPFPVALHDRGVLDAVSDLTRDERAALERLATHVEAVCYYPDPAAVLVHYLFSDAPYLRRVLRADAAAAGQIAAAIAQLIALARGFRARPLLSPSDDVSLAFLRYVRRLLSEGETSLAHAATGIPGAVNVLTVHTAKGLEFPVVYVPNLAAGRFPPRPRGGARVVLPPRLDELAGHRDDEGNLFFVAISRARERLVLSRAERYGGRSARESSLLAALHAAHPLAAGWWPHCDGDDRPEQGEESQARDLVVISRDLEAMARCPAQHNYLHRLGVYGDDTANGYRTFAHLLRRGVRRLRTLHETAEWPATWPQAALEMARWWDERQPADGGLDRWYRAVALDTFKRIYETLSEEGQLSAARYGAEETVQIEGIRVQVRIDAIEQLNGVPHLIHERATRTSDDTASLTIALYGAVARSLAPAAEPMPVAIRYLDSGNIDPVPDPARALSKHRERIVAAAERMAAGRYAPEPDDDEECLRCPLVFVCPR